MADVSYAPGTLTAVAGDRCRVLIDATPDSPAVGWLWQQLSQRARPEAILAGLLGADFAGATEFALLYQEDSGAHRLFCRGAVAATVQGTEPARGGVAGGPAEAGLIDGSGLLTWREHVVPDTVSRIVLGAPPADGALRLPATAGVLLASCVVVDLTDADADAAIRETAPYGSPPAVRQTAGDLVPEFAGYPDTVTVIGPDSFAGGTGSPPAAGPSPVPVAGPPAAPAAGPSSVPAAGPSSAPVASPPPAPVAPPSAAAGPPPAVDEEYDFLWGATQARSVADAAITVPEADGARPPAFSASGAFPDVSTGTGIAVSEQPWLPPVTSSPLPAPGGLIDAMPWGPDPAAPDEADENGFTVKRGDLPELAARSAPPPDKIGPAVPALICPAGHVNPPSEAGCGRCGAALPPDPVVVPRPVLGVLRLSAGDVISLDRDVVMGRSPKPDFAGADGEERPHFVKLTGADSDISRTHLRVTLDGWHVLVTDLNSKNGTLVTLPGRESEQLRPGHPVPIKPGTVVTLADGIDFRYEVPE